MTLERPPAQAPAAPPESSRSAWVAVVLAPVVTIGALTIGFALEGKWWGELLALALVAAPILGGFTLGFRSARTGNTSGALAAATATAEAVFIVMFLIGANVIEFASDGTTALVGVGAAVAGFVVTTLALYRIGSERRGVR